MEWNPTDFETKISLQFKSEQLLRLALIDKSYAEQANEPETNARLDHLGRAVLDLAIADYLYTNCPYLETSKLTRLGEKLVEGDRLTNLWFSLGLGTTYPLLAASESRPHLRKQAHNPFEVSFRALIGAIHRDRGYVQARNWLQKHLIVPVLGKHVKQGRDRTDETKQARWLGEAVVRAILDDYLYASLPNVDVELLAKLQRALSTKEVQSTWEGKLTAADRERLPSEKATKPVQLLAARTFLDARQDNDKLAFRTTQAWFVEQFLDTEAILREAIVRLQAAGMPQKWIVANVLGYASKDYHAGRDRFQEILTGKHPGEEATPDSEERDSEE